MNIEDVERFFLANLADRGVHGIQTRRNDESGELLVRMESPCPDVGYIAASVNDVEITLSCRITHTHSDADYFTRCGVENPQLRMIEEAARAFADFVQGRSFVEQEITHDGLLGASGWRTFGEPRVPNPRYRAVIESLHGGPSTIRAWSWAGEINGIEWDY
jgi:hypothetical protein